MLVPSATSSTALSLVRGGGGGGLAGLLLSNIRAAAIPALPIAGGVLLTFVLEVKAKSRRSKKPDVDDAAVAQSLRSHRDDKVRVLMKTLPADIAGILAVIAIRAFRRDLWRPAAGPPLHLVVLSFAFWASEVTMDCCLDECAPLQPLLTVVLSATTQLALIYHLVTSHIVFFFKAVEVLLATAIAKVIDNPQWLTVAILSVLGLGVAAVTKCLPPLHPTRPAGAAAYLACTVGASTAYQMVQNNTSSSKSGMATIKMARSVGRLAAVAVGAPLQWVLYDTVTLSLFLSIKILVDSVALRAIRQKDQAF